MQPLAVLDGMVTSSFAMRLRRTPMVVGTLSSMASTAMNSSGCSSGCLGGLRPPLPANHHPIQQKTRWEQNKPGSREQTDGQHLRVEFRPATVRQRKRQHRQRRHDHQGQPANADAFQDLGQIGPRQSAMEDGTAATFGVVVME
jgi:hypothetical protein